MLKWIFHFMRRGQWQADVRKELRCRLSQTVLYLGLIFSVHALLMVKLEGFGVADALWLTLTTATTVGYGDLSAVTPLGRIATILLIYIGGIFVLAKMAGDYFDYRTVKHLKKIRGEWIWNMQGHILIINSPAENGELYFTRLIEQFRTSDLYKDCPIQILTRDFPMGLPDSLSAFGNVVLYQGEGDEPEDLVSVDADKAELIVLLAPEEQNRGSDSRTFDILHRLSELGVKARVLAECVDDRNRSRFKGAGAHLIIRPMRAYPEMIVRGFVAPGSEQIIENMFTSSKDEYVRYDVSVTGMMWKDIVCRLIEHDLGTAIAYVSSEDGELYDNPAAKVPIEAQALILMVREECIPSLPDVEKALFG